jgi:hypothetical protein
MDGPQSSVSFSAAFPFPCLFYAEDDQPAAGAGARAPAAPAPAASSVASVADGEEDEAGDDEDAFDLDEFMETARERSSTGPRPPAALGADGQPVRRFAGALLTARASSTGARSDRGRSAPKPPLAPLPCPASPQLLDYELHPQHRRDQKEALPSSLVRGGGRSCCQGAATKTNRPGPQPNAPKHPNRRKPQTSTPPSRAATSQTSSPRPS